MYKLIRDISDFDEGELIQEMPLFCDTETYTDPGRTSGGLYGNVRLFQMYQKGMDKAIILDAMFIPLSDILDIVKKYSHVYHNSSYDLHTVNCYTESTWLPENVADTLYLSRLALYKKGPKFDFYSCLDHAGVSDDIIRSIDKKANQEADWGGILTSTMLKYAACDVVYLSKLYDVVCSAIGTEAYMLDIENMRYAIEYSRRGIPINRKTVISQMKTTVEKLESLLETLPLNPNSPKQCCEALGSKSSDKDTLVHLALKGNTLAADIRDARTLSKTFMFLKKYNRPVMKGFYNPCGAISGRFSCTGGDAYDHENTQQTPRRILPCYEAPEGYVFVYKDYAGLELRMADAWTGDPVMERMIKNGVDLHSYTGSIIFGIPMDKLTKTQRMIGKILNFLLIYGGSITAAQTTIRAWGNLLMEYQEVKQLVEKWFEEYDYYKQWHSMTKRHILVYGYMDIETALGRRVRTYTLNDALNTPIQGSSAEVQKTSLLILKNRYPDENLISTIHDSNTLLVLEDKADYWVQALNECMVEGWYHVIKNLSIPDLPMPPEAEYKKVWQF